MASQLTYTGATGPAKTLTSTVFSDVKSLKFDAEHGIVTVEHGSPKQTAHLDLTALSSATVTLSSGVVTATLS